MNPVALREILKEIKDRHSLGDYGGKSPHNVETLEFCLLELESQIPRWTPITVAVPDEYEIVLFKMVELVAPDIFAAFPDTIETRTSYFTGYRVDKIYRDHLHNCVRNYVRLEWVRIFKEEES